MNLIAELTLHGDVVLFEATFATAPEAEATFEDVHYVTAEDDYRHYVFFWWVTAPDFQAFEDALAADATVDEFRHVAAIDDRALYRVVTRELPPEQPLVFPAFREHDVTAVESRRNAAGLHLRARFPDRDALNAFVDTASEIADNVDVTGLYTEKQTENGAPELTQRQREALEHAFVEGYFETPSEVTLAELADAFDVTPQTMSRHVRVGVHKLVEDAVDTNESVAARPST